MKLLIVAVLLSLVQAPPPVPRQTADKAPPSAQGVKQQPYTQQSPTPDSSSVPNPTTANADKDKGGTPAKTDPQETIFITESAAVPVKDWWERAYVLFTGLLVFIGALGVHAAIKTLREIKQQATEMQKQRTAMEGQLEVMQRQSEFIVAQNRAWLVVTNVESPGWTQ